MTEPLSKTVSDSLLARIARGEYRAGDRLPTEVELMAEYGVGRNTVREAMQGLRTLGLVEIRPRLGATVLDSPAGTPLTRSAISVLLNEHTIDELYEVRLILEPAAAAKAAIERTDADLAAIRRALTHFRVAFETGDNVYEADIEFHQAVAQASGNGVMARILAPVSDLLAAARQATGTLPVAVERALHEHEAIAAAIEARSSRRAKAAMATHIESAIWAIGQLKDENAS
ncbi:FadR family transcriptional regulator [Nocardioides humilatus]|uniref:FadR family transcriptional regulator n=1 Tax=Nocardioides humilatus TaxID=2607660 RepID=A0A5B1LQ41_9ACTN|nr:FCD domain-containing protein [Nocardioides humilatus]KAA1421809.1 FadR family transcriptional regulator [Nocardioides humilatus]